MITKIIKRAFYVKEPAQHKSRNTKYSRIIKNLFLSIVLVSLPINILSQYQYNNPKLLDISLINQLEIEPRLNNRINSNHIDNPKEIAGASYFMVTHFKHIWEFGIEAGVFFESSFIGFGIYNPFELPRPYDHKVGEKSDLKAEPDFDNIKTGYCYRGSFPSFNLRFGIPIKNIVCPSFIIGYRVATKYQVYRADANYRYRFWDCAISSPDWGETRYIDEGDHFVFAREGNRKISDNKVDDSSIEIGFGITIIITEKFICNFSYIPVTELDYNYFSIGFGIIKF